MSFQLNLDTETVAHAFPVTVLTVSSSTPLREALDAMNSAGQGHVLVTDDENRLTGIFTERDALRLMAQDTDWDSPIGDHMAANPVALSNQDAVATAISKMASGGYRHLPIVNDQQQPKGVLSVRGILHYLVEHFPQTIYNLPPTPHHNTQEREGA